MNSRSPVAIDVPFRIHLQRLQVLQALCENHGMPFTLVLADLRHALTIRTYFEVLLEPYHCNADAILQSLNWAIDRFTSRARLEEDVIQALVEEDLQIQYVQRIAKAS